MTIISDGPLPVDHTARPLVAEVLAQTVRERHEKVIADAVDEVRAIAADVVITGSAVLGEPATVLLAAGRSAAMTVVGSRGHGGFGSLLLGSVSQKVATHARHPVVVVPGSVDTATGPVIVGVDHTGHSEHTIGAAFEEAVRRGSPVIAIHAYELPAVYRVRGDERAAVQAGGRA